MDFGAITEIRLLELAAKEAGVHKELLTNQSLKDKLNNSHRVRREWNPIHSSEEAIHSQNKRHNKLLEVIKTYHQLLDEKNEIIDKLRSKLNSGFLSRLFS